MQISILKSDIVKAKSLTFIELARGENFDVSSFETRLLSGRSVGVWKPPVVTYVASDDRRTSDFLSLGFVPVLNARCVEALEDLLLENGEILTLESTEGEFYAYNVLNIIDALDTQKSAIEWFPVLRSRVGPPGIRSVGRYCFRSEAIGHSAFFRVPSLQHELFVTETVEERVSQWGLTGFVFERL